MKKIYSLNKTLLLILTLVGFSISSNAANIQWDPAASTTNWNDAANWVGGVIPGPADAAIFPTAGAITITGTAPSAVGSLQAWNGVDLSLDLNLTVASTNGTVVRIFAGSTITVKSGATLTVTVTGTNAAAINLWRDNSTFNIESGATVDLTAWRGIGSNNQALTAAVNNSGTMNITSTNAAIQPNNPTAMTIINHPCAIINLLNAATNGKMKIWSNAATSSIINNGLITYAGSTAPVSVTTGNVATNNAFYQTASGTPGFSSGSSTSQTNNGILVNSTVALDAGTSCTVDINGNKTGMEAYLWAYGGATFNANAADGTLDLSGAGFPDETGPHTITISDPGCTQYNTEFTVTVANPCPAAVISPLPVELTTFTATQNDKVNILKWQTASEIDNDYFEVQSSTDGIDFRTMEIIEGNGSTFETSDYKYVDAQPADITYYRLQQFNYDGASEKSNIVVVERERSGVSNDEVSLFPMPVNDVLSVKYDASSKEDMTILVMDITGRILSIQEEVTTKGNNLFEVDFSNIPAGNYFIKLQLRNQSIVERVINQ